MKNPDYNKIYYIKRHKESKLKKCNCVEKFTNTPAIKLKKARFNIKVVYRNTQNYTDFQCI